MKLTRNIKLYLAAFAVCLTGYFFSHPVNASDSRLPNGATRESEFRFYCPKLENVMFADDGRLVVGKDTFRLSSGRNDTLVFIGATGIAILRGEAQPDGNLYFDNARLTVAGKDYECVAI